MQRKDATAQIMHHINYAYNAKNNRLQAITATGINSSNYSYDAIGNLANDSGENIQVSWNAMNKVKQVNFPNNRQLQFSYSPTGQRQIKRSADKTEYYLHDATGNIMCIYELSGKYLTVKERTIYGSKRIGVYRQRIQLTAFTGFGQAVLLPGSGLVNVLHPQPIISPDGRHYLEGSNRLQVIGVARTTLSVNTLAYAYKKGTPELKGLSPSIAARPTFLDGAKTAGLRDYELTDHLSNVMAVISDRKLSVDTNNDTITDYYEPQVVSFTDYYPFGFPMAERSGNLAGYRFGFNGQEADNEVYGVKTTYAFEYRMQDTRLGRFWSVDPLDGDYPWNSAYAFAENRVIDGIDLEGLEWAYYGKDKKQIDINNKTTDEDKLNIVGVRWAGYDVDEKGNKTPKAGTVATAYTFGLRGMTTSSIDKNGNPTQKWESYSSINTGDVSTDKKLGSLHPSIQNDMKSFILMAKYRFGIVLKVTDGYRTVAEQDELYAKGRTAPGNIVTKARGGYSNHNFGLAIDVVPIENGKLNWNTKQYPLIGKIGISRGLEWGGNWKFEDKPHFQNLHGRTLKELRSLPKDENGLPIFK